MASTSLADSKGGALSRENLGFVPPPERRLGSLHTHIAARPTLAGDPVQFTLRKLVGLIAASSPPQPGFTVEFLDEAAQLTEKFLGLVLTLLHRLTEVQRHLRPGAADLAMCFAGHGILPADLHAEYTRTRALLPKVARAAHTLADELARLRREQAAGTVAADDEVRAFAGAGQHEIAVLVPRQVKRRSYIPAYFPELPPDFTYRLTGSYAAGAPGPKEIALRLAAELRLNEPSLYRLIDDDDRRWRQGFEQTIGDSEAGDKAEEDQDEPQASDTKAEELHGETESTAAADAEDGLSWGNGHLTRFDFVAYARKRQRAVARRTERAEVRAQKRAANVFLQAEKTQSCYATGPRKDYANKLEMGFRRVVAATRKAQAAARQAKASVVREPEIEFGFHFDPASDDSDDEPADFQFGNEPGHADGHIENDFGLDSHQQEHQDHQDHHTDLNGTHLGTDLGADLDMDLGADLGTELNGADGASDDDIDHMLLELGPSEWDH